MPFANQCKLILSLLVTLCNCRSHVTKGQAWCCAARGELQRHDHPRFGLNSLSGGGSIQAFLKSLKLLSATVGIVAAILWFRSASVEIPLAPGAEIGGTLPGDPFNVAARTSVEQMGCGTTGLSVLLPFVAEGLTAL
jgi:hypothetical protein